MALVFGMQKIASELQETGFRTPFYPAAGYAGSRVLETDFVTKPYAKVNWTQLGTVDKNISQWIVNPEYHIIVKVPIKNEQTDFPSYGDVVAGKWGEAGHRDGHNAVALFDGPTGIAILED